MAKKPVTTPPPRKFKGSIGTNKVGSECTFEFEMPHNATEAQIEAEARDAAFEHIDWHFVEVK